MRNALLVGAASLLVLGSIGCGSGSTDVTVPTFQKGQGQTPQTGEVYPDAPYGINVGSVVANYHFVGFANSVADSSDMQGVALSDFYNPHANDPTYAPKSAAEDDRLYPAGSIYGEGNAKPTALLLDVSAVWCPPCNQESLSTLPPQYAALHSKGAEFLLDLTDGPNPGTAATPADLDLWTAMYHEDFPAVIDPEYELAALFAADFYPANLIVDTRTMKICKVVSGAPDPGTWALFGAVMANPNACQ
jgi:hypothetical protein